MKVAPGTEGSHLKPTGYYKEIEKIRAGDYVLTADEHTGKLSYGKVTETFIHDANYIRKLSYTDGLTVETTWNHPFWIQGEGWTEVRDIEAGKKSVTAESILAGMRMPKLQLASFSGVNPSRWDDASQGTLEVSGNELIVRADKVYNIEVEGTHSYFVTESDVLVHNYEGDESVGLPKKALEYVKNGYNRLKNLIKTTFSPYKTMSEEDMKKDRNIANQVGATDENAPNYKKDLNKRLRKNDNIKTYGNTGEYFQYCNEDMCRALQRVANSLPKDQKLYINDISLPDGAKTNWHANSPNGGLNGSHNSGAGVDVKMPTKDNKAPPGGMTYRSPEYSKDKTIKLIDTFANKKGKDNNITILFNDPEVISHYRKKPKEDVKVRWSSGHDNHIHAFIYPKPEDKK